MCSRIHAWVVGMLLIAALGAGCTTKGNKIADAAFAYGNQNTDAIVHDLSTGYTQLAIDRYAAIARQVARDGDEDAAASAVTRFATEYDKITWLAREQYGRSRDIHRIARRYIWQQRGWGSVLYRDWMRASKKERERPDPG